MKKLKHPERYEVRQRQESRCKYVFFKGDLIAKLIIMGSGPGWVIESQHDSIGDGRADFDPTDHVCLIHESSLTPKTERWEYDVDQDQVAPVGESYYVAEIFSPDGKKETDRIGHLIAAAPQLLEACKGVVDWRECDSNGDDQVRACFAAIEAAEGKS